MIFKILKGLRNRWAKKARLRNRIAVVHYEKELADLLAEIIRGGGYEVDVFTNSLLASEIIGSQHAIYSLVLTSWRMPSLSGRDLGMRLSKIDPGIKIILILALDAGFSCEFDHIIMPVTPSELIETINNKIKNGK